MYKTKVRDLLEYRLLQERKAIPPELKDYVVDIGVDHTTLSQGFQEKHEFIVRMCYSVYLATENLDTMLPQIRNDVVDNFIRFLYKDVVDDLLDLRMAAWSRDWGTVISLSDKILREIR